MQDAQPVTTDSSIVRRIMDQERTILELATQLAASTPPSRHPDLTMRQLLLLHLLSGRPQSVGEIAEAFGVTISSASGLVDRLARSRLVRRVPGTTDRRLVICQVTDTGAAVLNEHLEMGRMQLERLLAELPAADLGVVENAMNLLIGAARQVIARNGRSTTVPGPGSMG
jgi:DNA-binding MarR family transcriptional regulator